MAEPTASHDSLTVEEYLKLEESATVRHEYLGSEIFAMVGATKRHNRIGRVAFGKIAPWSPVRKMHRMPLSTFLGSRQGLPRPSTRRGGSGIRGLKISHCSWVRSMLLLNSKN
jgi:hypothetical protein